MSPDNEYNIDGIIDNSLNTFMLNNINAGCVPKIHVYIIKINIFNTIAPITYLGDIIKTANAIIGKNTNENIIAMRNKICQKVGLGASNAPIVNNMAYPIPIFIDNNAAIKRNTQKIFIYYLDITKFKTKLIKVYPTEHSTCYAR